MDRPPRAFALIVVLVASAVVFAIAVQAATFARAATSEAAALVRRARVERDARSAASIAIASLVAADVQRSPFDPDDDGSGAGAGSGGAPTDAGQLRDNDIPEMPAAMRELIGQLSGEEPTTPEPDAQAQRPEQSRSTRSNAPRRSPIYEALRRRGLPHRPIRVALDEQRAYTVAFRDARAGLEVNAASESELARLFQLRGVPAPDNIRIAQEIADYRDEDDFVRERGAERDEYARRGLTPRNADIQTLEELLFLPSMTTAIYHRVRDALCVRGDGRVHAPSAPADAIRALDGVTPAGAEALIERRSQGPMTIDDLEDALSPLSARALDRMRLAPLPLLVAIVHPEGGGPGAEITISLESRGGVEFLATRPAPPAPQEPAR